MYQVEHNKAITTVEKTDQRVVTARVPASLEDELRRQAATEDRSAASIVRLALRRYLDGPDGE